MAHSFIAWATTLATDTSSLLPSLIVRCTDLKISFGNAAFILSRVKTSLAQSSSSVCIGAVAMGWRLRIFSMASRRGWDGIGSRGEDHFLLPKAFGLP